MEPPAAQRQFAAALRELGVRDDCLSDAERAQLDAEGWLALPGLLPGQQCDTMAAESRRLWLEAGRPEGGGVVITELQDRSRAFDVCFSHPRVLAAVSHVLSAHPFYSAGIHASSPNWPPPDRHQGLHWDGQFSAFGNFLCCNSFWLLSDFSREGVGATRLVPKTHLLRQASTALLDDAEAEHPEELRMAFPPGTCVVWNARVWHGASANTARADRASVQAFFSRRWYPSEDQSRGHDGSPLEDRQAIAAAARRRENRVSAETWARLSPAARALFDPPLEQAGLPGTSRL